MVVGPVHTVPLPTWAEAFSGTGRYREGNRRRTPSLLLCSRPVPGPPDLPTPPRQRQAAGCPASWFPRALPSRQHLSCAPSGSRVGPEGRRWGRAPSTPSTGRSGAPTVLGARLAQLPCSRSQEDPQPALSFCREICHRVSCPVTGASAGSSLSADGAAAAFRSCEIQMPAPGWSPPAGTAGPGLRRASPSFVSPPVKLRPFTDAFHGFPS